MSSWSDRINEVINRLEAAALAEAEARVAKPAAPPVFAQPVTPVPPPQPKLEPRFKQTKTVQAAQPEQVQIKLAAQDMMQGVIFAEILGPPLARRRGRGRHGF